MLKASYSNKFSDKPIDNTMNILVVDNNVLLINLLEKSLVQDGVKISAVTNIEDAIQLLKEKIFDAVLCDGPINNYSKETILEIFEQNNFLRDQRIVLFSGLTQPNFIEKWKRKGLYNYIKKPTSRKKILEFLHATKNDSNLKKTFTSQTMHEQIEKEEEATPEQLAKIEELTKQIEELESQSTKPTPNTEVTYKTEIDLESAEQTKVDEKEEEATPEQLAKIEELTKQIEELESQSTKPTPNTEVTYKTEIDYSKTQLSQTTFETQTNSEFKNILSKLASIKNQFLYNTSDIANIDHVQTTEELFNLKKEISRIRRKVYRSRPKQTRNKSTSSQNKKTKKQQSSKKKRK